MWAVGVEEEPNGRRKQMCEEVCGDQAPGLDSGFSSPYCTVCSLSLAVHLMTSSALSQPLHSTGASSLHSLSHYFLPLPTGHNPDGYV